MSATIDVRTDDGLRDALSQVDRARSWDIPAGGSCSARFAARCPQRRPGVRGDWCCRRSRARR